MVAGVGGRLVRADEDHRLGAHGEGVSPAVRGGEVQGHDGVVHGLLVVRQPPRAGVDYPPRQRPGTASSHSVVIGWATGKPWVSTYSIPMAWRRLAT